MFVEALHSKYGIIIMYLYIKITSSYYCHVCYHYSLSPCSIDKVRRVTSKVLVIHGTDDEVIDFSHGLAIHDAAPNTVEPLWVEGAGHNDIELYGQYMDRIRRFVNVEMSSSS